MTAVKILSLAPESSTCSIWPTWSLTISTQKGEEVDVLLRIYAKCVVGQDELAKRRISEALRQD